MSIRYFGDTAHTWHVDAIHGSNSNDGLSYANAKASFWITLVDSGTTDGTTSSKLVDSTQNFLTTVEVNDVVHNTTDDTYATVTAVDSDTTLSLDADIMVSGEAYEIHEDAAGSARPGDTILLYPGTYSTGLDNNPPTGGFALDKRLNIVGVNRDSCILQPADSSKGNMALIIKAGADGSSFENIHINGNPTQSGQTPETGVHVDDNVDGVAFIDCKIDGYVSGVDFQATGCKRWRFEGCTIRGGSNALVLGQVRNFIFESCFIKAGDDWNTSATSIKAVTGGFTSILFNNCIVEAHQPSGHSATDLIGVEITLASSHFILINCPVYLNHEDMDSNSNNAYFCKFSAAGLLSLKNCGATYTIGGTTTFGNFYGFDCNQGQLSIQESSILGSLAGHVLNIENVITQSSTGQVFAGQLAYDTNLISGVLEYSETNTQKVAGDDPLTASDIAAQVNTDLDRTGYSLSSSGNTAIWHVMLSAINDPSTIGKLIEDFLDINVSSRLSQTTGDDIKIKTDGIN